MCGAMTKGWIRDGGMERRRRMDELAVEKGWIWGEGMEGGVSRPAV